MVRNLFTYALKIVYTHKKLKQLVIVYHYKEIKIVMVRNNRLLFIKNVNKKINSLEQEIADFYIPY